RGLICSRPLLIGGIVLVAFDRGQNARGLFWTHDRDASVRPHEQKAWRIGTTAHRIVASTKGAADDYSDLWNPSGRNSGHHFGAVFRDSAGFVVLADHKTRNILEKEQRNAALVGELYEVSTL